MWSDPQNPEFEWAHALCYTSPEGDILVFRRCPICGRFIQEGEAVLENGLGAVTFLGWICTRCGEINPDWDRTE